MSVVIAMRRVLRIFPNVKHPINFTWPEKISYHNPVIGFRSDLSRFTVKLYSGENIDNIAPDEKWERIDWPKITCLGISYFPNKSFVGDVSFNTKEFFSYQHYDFRKGERVVGIHAHKYGN